MSADPWAAVARMLHTTLERAASLCRNCGVAMRLHEWGCPVMRRERVEEKRAEQDRRDAVELERLRLLFAAGRCKRWVRVGGQLVDLLRLRAGH